ncbi:unnamed protein product [Symbiodinium sp. CCMP2592]|nr:unnamed protein product [Symbiodinium sp. CCMP2592]CAE7257162.1 unnamed protein product [Symbiodinium sp. CCMP2592]
MEPVPARLEGTVHTLLTAKATCTFPMAGALRVLEFLMVRRASTPAAMLSHLIAARAETSVREHERFGLVSPLGMAVGLGLSTEISILSAHQEPPALGPKEVGTPILALPVPLLSQLASTLLMAALCSSVAGRYPPGALFCRWFSLGTGTLAKLRPVPLPLVRCPGILGHQDFLRFLEPLVGVPVDMLRVTDTAGREQVVDDPRMHTNTILLLRVAPTAVADVTWLQDQLRRGDLSLVCFAQEHGWRNLSCPATPSLVEPEAAPLLASTTSAQLATGDSHPAGCERWQCECTALACGYGMVWLRAVVATAPHCDGAAHVVVGPLSYQYVGWLLALGADPAVLQHRAARWQPAPGEEAAVMPRPWAAQQGLRAWGREGTVTVYRPDGRLICSVEEPVLHRDIGEAFTNDPSGIIVRGAYQLIVFNPVSGGTVVEQQSLLRDSLLRDDPQSLVRVFEAAGGFATCWVWGPHLCPVAWALDQPAVVLTRVLEVARDRPLPGRGRLQEALELAALRGDALQVATLVRHHRPAPDPGDEDLQDPVHRALLTAVKAVYELLAAGYSSEGPLLGQALLEAVEHTAPLAVSLGFCQ